jgi:hypothetical protein
VPREGGGVIELAGQGDYAPGRDASAVTLRTFAMITRALEFFEPTAFARVMILPAALCGRSSIRYVLPEDVDKPKHQTYQLFVDDPIDR